MALLIGFTKRSLSLSKRFEWSPDSKQLAYIKFNEEAVPTYGDDDV